MHQHWDELLRHALVGTDRRPLTPELRDAAEAAGIATSDSDDARQLLDSLLLVRQVRRAGYVPEQVAIPELEYAGNAPTEREAPASTVDLVALLLTAKQDAPLVHLLRQLAEYGRVLPAAVLPALLDKATKATAIATALTPVLGQRGRWLLQQRPKWRPILPDLSRTAIWSTGKPATRIAWIESLRRTHPEQAAQLIADTWQDETSKLKEQLLTRILPIQPGTYDLDLLRAILVEGGRWATDALEVLARIPESDIATQVIALLRPIDRQRVSDLQRATLLVPMRSLGLDTDWLQKQGKSAPALYWWLHGLVPMAQWYAEYGTTPQAWVEWLDKTQSRLGLDATIHAALRDGDIATQVAVLKRWELRPFQPVWEILHHSGILREAAPAALHEAATAWLQQQPINSAEDAPLTQLLTLSEQPWDETMTWLFAGHLADWLRRNSNHQWKGWHYKKLIEKMGFYAPPALHSTLQKTLLDQLDYLPGWTPTIETMLERLALRKRVEEGLG